MMKKLTARLWMLAAAIVLGLASCSVSETDNPATDPDEPQQQQLADYTLPDDLAPARKR